MDIEVKMPDIGLDEVEVIEILVSSNEKIKKEQDLITVEGEKASMEVPSPVSGLVKNIYVNIGDKIKTDSIIMLVNINNNDLDINKEDKNLLEKELKLSQKDCFTESKTLNKESFYSHATPVVRRLARSLNIKLDNIVGTGPKNRILKEDIELYQNHLTNNNSKHICKDDLHCHNLFDIKEVELSRLQQITGNNLHRNWTNIPHVTQFDEVNITTLEKFRQKYNTENKNNPVMHGNITILAFILKVVACALERFPIFNSSLNLNNKNIILKKYINIGIAVDVQDGLLVPVLKDVNQKSIQKLSNELILISTKARERKLIASDMDKGCFTISNLGGIGGGWFSPIINAPEVAILGVSKAQIKPLWNGQEFVPSFMLPLSLSYDHRVINGADGARFLTFIGKLLSDIHFLVM